MFSQTNRSAYPIAEEAVPQRYSAGAEAVEPALCCAVAFDPRYLEAIPAEVMERDYGCGDPTPFVRANDTVLDLGAGGGKVCFIAAQIVGPNGRVIGVDCNRDMLALARRHRPTVAERLGYTNVEFRCGLIQDLRLDLDLLAEELSRQPVQDQWGWLAVRSIEERLRQQRPLIPDESVDCVISNCVLNLVRLTDRKQLFAEVYRVLKQSGRVAISDIVADEDVPEHLKSNPQLWSGCISGAYREDAFLHAFEEAGFHGIEIIKRQKEPWRTLEGIEFRSITVLAHKGKHGPGLERNQTLIYRGPFKKVEDDDGHEFRRGERMAVCDNTFQILQREPYVGFFEAIQLLEQVPLDMAKVFECCTPAGRPQDTKGQDYSVTKEEAVSGCGLSGACCTTAAPHGGQTGTRITSLTLIRRGSALADSTNQRQILAKVSQRAFEQALADNGLWPLRAAGTRILQVNVGKRCNQTCRHCHVDAGPDRVEVMSRATMQLCLDALSHSDIATLDITGGAPEINPDFRWFVKQARGLGRHVIDRCNLTILLVPHFEDLPDFLAQHRVEVVASLPCYLPENTNWQRGNGVFEKSIVALRRLNQAGYGKTNTGLMLTLVYNPIDQSLPPSQAMLEDTYREELSARYGIVFNRLFTITNMPISRFLADLIETGRYEEYMEKLIAAYNPAAAAGVMCRTMVSVGWDGQLYDCDFNQMLDLGLSEGLPRLIRDYDPMLMASRRIVTGQHCYGCTAGNGSGCQGAIAK